MHADASSHNNPATCMNEQHLPLPPPFTIDSISEYIDALIGFVREYKSIVHFNSHHVFTQGLPVDWLPKYTVETWLSIASGGFLEEILPEPLEKFLRLARELPLGGPIRMGESLPAPPTRKNLTAQKSHEIDAVIGFLKELTKRFNIEAKRVVDVGAGLGYLSQELEEIGYQVVAIEGNPERAAEVAEKANIECIARMVNRPCDLDVTADPCLAVGLSMVPE
jgi:hypothetical protein